MMNEERRMKNVFNDGIEVIKLTLASIKVRFIAVIVSFR